MPMHTTQKNTFLDLNGREQPTYPLPPPVERVAAVITVEGRVVRSWVRARQEARGWQLGASGRTSGSLRQKRGG